jgi:glutamate-1-semialdehyde 2,1-aminomutase
MDHGIDLDRVRTLKRREDLLFASTHPRSAELRVRARRTMPLGVPLSWMEFLYDHPPIFVHEAEGAHFTDVDGRSYLDMSLGITVASAGHTPQPVIAAVADRMARGIQFNLPTEDAIAVSEELWRRWGLPKWQYQLSSTQANADAVHLARAITGREKIVVFEGKYQGHLAELLAIPEEDRVVPEYLGISEHDIARTVVVPWNDLDRVADALDGEDVALLLAEPALTNSGIVFPADGFHDELRRLTSSHGTLLAVDETQTAPMAFGGLTREWGLAPDLLTLGKSIGAGVPVAALGMTDAVSGAIDRPYTPYEVSGEVVDEPAIGGTMFGNALSMAALRTALIDVWTEEAHARMQQLARSLAGGLETAIRSHGRDWDVYQLGNRAGYRFAPTPPLNNTDAERYDLPAVRHLQRVYLANRGIWDFGWWGGPAISAQTTADDVDVYLRAFAGFVDELLG